MSNPTYPGTVAPLRGLGSFSESERDGFYGRDRDRDDLSRLLTGHGVRAALLYGESGVGKTSLLRAGLQPDLRDHGVVALYCADNHHPLNSFAHALGIASGQSPQPKESSAQFLSRLISEKGQMYLFILDDIDDYMVNDEKVIHELAELFTRVASRSGGRARFLFSCDSAKVHRFAALEKRTGSLFPPTCRYHLQRLSLQDAVTALQHSLAKEAISVGPDVPPAIVHDLLHSDQTVLPADLQIAALALRGQSIGSASALEQLGGTDELTRQWLCNAAAATGNERSGLRLLSALATTAEGPCLAQQLATTANVDLDFTQNALQTLQSSGLVLQLDAIQTSARFSLSHDVLKPRIHAVAAPAIQSARQAFEILSTKAASGKVLNPREFWEIHRQEITPTTQQERAVLAKTVLVGKLLGAALITLPIVLIILSYRSMSGQYYLDTQEHDSGATTIVVRAGTPSWLQWLPSSPQFGTVVADSGLTQNMVTADAWRDASSTDITGILANNDYSGRIGKMRRASDGHLVDYVLSGSGDSLQALQRAVTGPDDYVKLLRALRPVTQSTSDEVLLVQQALQDPGPAVQIAALSVAATGASRTTAYDSVLALALTNESAETRRLAISVVRPLPPKTLARIVAAAMELDSSKIIRRQLRLLQSPAAKLSTVQTTELGGEITKANRKRWQQALTETFQRGDIAADIEAVRVISHPDSDDVDKIVAMEELAEYGHTASLKDDEALLLTVQKLVNAGPIAEDTKGGDFLRAAAIILYARMDSVTAAGVMAVLLADADLSVTTQVGLAKAWGQVAHYDKATRGAAQGALEKLLKSEHRQVKAAAAQAYGFSGRISQSLLSKMVKTEFVDVAEHAAYGLANSTAVGASADTAIAGILEMWSKKGKLRRIATKAFARLAKYKPSSVHSYLTTASRSTEDIALHPIAMRGLCDGLKAGYSKMGRDLVEAASHPVLEIREIAIQCVVDYPKDTKISAQVALAMAEDSDTSIRVLAAQVLASLAPVKLTGRSNKGVNKKIAAALSTMIRDSEREIRMVAIAAVANLDSPSSNAQQRLLGAFPLADQVEKLQLLQTAESIGAGAVIPLAIADGNPQVRIKALEVAIAINRDVLSMFNSSLTDPDVSVRRAAIDMLANRPHKLTSDEIEQALVLVISDEDPTIAELAMVASAGFGSIDVVKERTLKAMDNPSETQRVQAVTTAMGLLSKAPAAVVEILETRYADPSHDVRVSIIKPLAVAYSQTRTLAELAQMFTASEEAAHRRLVLAASFVLIAGDPDFRDDTLSTLKTLVDQSNGFVQKDALLAQRLIESNADGIAFLQTLVP